MFGSMLARVSALNPRAFTLPLHMKRSVHSSSGMSRPLRLCASCCCCALFTVGCNSCLSNALSPRAEYRQEYQPKLRGVLECTACTLSGADIAQCSSCSRATHIYCLEPPLSSMPPAGWVCSLHQQPKVMRDHASTCKLVTSSTAETEEATERCDPWSWLLA
jgi:hypothetical protein